MKTKASLIQFGFIGNRKEIGILHRVSKNVPPFVCYIFDAREWILIFFGRNVTHKVGNQKTLNCATSNNLCFCTTCQNAETWKSQFLLNWIVLHTQCAYALSSWKNKLSSVMCLIASDICWNSKISHQYCSLTFTPGLTKNNSHLLHSNWHRDILANTEHVGITDSKMLCTLPIGPVWCTQSIVLTVKGGSALTRWYLNCVLCFFGNKAYMQHLIEKT